LLFASDIGLEILDNSPKWHKDGIFQKCPKLFYQILKIFTLYKDEIIAVAYIILPDKQQPSYLLLYKIEYMVKNQKNLYNRLKPTLND
jgi:hypothetical protein